MTTERTTTFKDSQGRSWRIYITAKSVFDIKRETGVDITKIFDKDSRDASEIDGLDVFLPILWILIRDQVDKLETPLSEADFYESCLAEHIEGAVRAVHNALVHFFPEARREALYKILDLAAKVQAKSAAILQKYATDPRIDTKTEELMKEAEQEYEDKLNAILAMETSTPPPGN